MKKIRITEAKTLSRDEENKLYGPRKTEIGKCFARTGSLHMYMQRENDVLHVTEELINTLSEGYLNDKEGLVEIDPEKFVLYVKEQIYRMEIDSFWKN